MCETPADGRKRRRVVLGELEANRHLPAPGRRWASGLGVSPDAPTARDLLEAVLVVGEALQAGPEMAFVVVGEPGQPRQPKRRASPGPADSAAVVPGWMASGGWVITGG